VSFFSGIIGTAERVPLPDAIIRAAIQLLYFSHRDQACAWPPRACSATPIAANGASAIVG